MDLSIIIVSYNVKDLARECLDRIGRSKDVLKKEIIVVNNASSDGSAEMIKQNFKDVIIIENKRNIGFAGANIQGIGISKGEFILLVNSDVFVAEDSIEKAVGFMSKNPNCGILGVRIVDKNGQLQPSARYFPTPWRLFLSYSGIGNKFADIPFLRGVDNMKWGHDSVREADWVPGLFFLMRKKMLDKIGFFDPKYFLYYEEVDLCLRAKKNGWKILFYPWAEVIHLGGESAKRIGKITSAGKQLEKFRFKSEFIYFRKNFGIFYVILDFFFIILLDIIGIIKKMLMPAKNISIRGRIKHMGEAWQILAATRLGGLPGN